MDFKGQEEAGNWLHFGALFEAEESAAVPTYTLIVPKTEPGGCSDHGC